MSNKSESPNPKIIAILPAKNEAWILPTFFSAMRGIADEIIILDDNSSDATATIAKKNGAIVIKMPRSNKRDKENNVKAVPMSTKRQILLDAARKNGATHIVCLDADEVFSSNFKPIAKEMILKLNPGQKLTLEWIQLWKSLTQFRDDSSPLANSWKDFAFCDDGSNFPTRFLSEFRTPPTKKSAQKTASSTTPIKIKREIGVVLHYQFVLFERVQLKQAWYRCSELVNTSTKAGIINFTYAMTLDTPNVKTKNVQTNWTSGIVQPNILLELKKDTERKTNWHLKEILQWFDKYGVTFFEPLQIWHIPVLKKEFVRRANRAPKSERMGSFAYFFYKNLEFIINKMKKYFELL